MITTDLLALRNFDVVIAAFAVPHNRRFYANIDSAAIPDGDSLFQVLATNAYASLFFR
jgi:hypothetical protein